MQISSFPTDAAFFGSFFLVLIYFAHLSSLFFNEIFIMSKSFIYKLVENDPLSSSLTLLTTLKELQCIFVLSNGILFNFDNQNISAINCLISIYLSNQFAKKLGVERELNLINKLFL